MTLFFFSPPTYGTLHITTIRKKKVSQMITSAKVPGTAARNGVTLTIGPLAAFTPFIPPDTSPFLSNVQLVLRVKEVQQGQLEEQGHG